MLKKYALHLLLFLLTFAGTTLAGAEWVSGKSYAFGGLDWGDLLGGLRYSVSFLAILTVHEFGHYFTAKYYQLKVSLPYYIPFWFFGFGPSIGTMGAFIRIKSEMRSRRQYFDVGIAGPLAGFALTLCVLYYGFTHLPPIDYVFKIHPEYAQYGASYPQHVYKNLTEGSGIAMGTNLLFEFFKHFVVDDPARIPPPQEIIHYPWLLSGFLACFFTALNLIPIGQLDGGHILYGLIGHKKSKYASLIFFTIFIYFAGLGLFSAHQTTEYLLTYSPLYLLFLYLCYQKNIKSIPHLLLFVVGIYTAQFLTKTFFPAAEGYQGWLLFAFLIGRVLGVYHPPARTDRPLDTKRKIAGWLALLIFVLCFSPIPFDI